MTDKEFARYVRKVLTYDPFTGKFHWRVRRSAKLAGSLAGSIHAEGYCYISVDRRRLLAHRLAWLYIYNCFPKNEIDHINSNPSDNRLENLREATSAENKANSRLRKNNTTGYKGVSFIKSRRRWVAQIAFNKSYRHLGYFNNPRSAYRAYCQAAKDTFGEFVNLGIAT